MAFDVAAIDRAAVQVTPGFFAVREINETLFRLAIIVIQHDVREVRFLGKTLWIVRYPTATSIKRDLVVFKLRPRLWGHSGFPIATESVGLLQSDAIDPQGQPIC